MSIVSSASTVLVSLSCVWSLAVPTTFPNIGYLGQGYDYMYGNPHATAVFAGPDPGFRAAVYNLSVYKGQLTPDQLYKVPYGIDVEKCNKCEVDFDTTAISGSSSYYHSLLVDVTADVSYGLAHFSASTDYKTVHNQTSSYNNVITESSAECCVYIGMVQQYTPPSLTANFQAAVKQLPTTYSANPASFAKFISSFGTHIPQTVSMGGRFGVRSTVAKNEWSMLSSSNLDVKVAAGYNALSFSAAVSTMDSTKTEQASAFKKSTTQQVQFVVGGTIPANGSATTWIQSAQRDPMPLSLGLKSIETLLSAANFPLDVSIAAKKTALTTALKNYCQSLVTQKIISTCVPPSKDPPFPPASIFGGIYQVDDCGKDNVINPYTKSLSCPQTYISHAVGRVLGPESNCGGTVNLCLAQGKTGDPLHYFGGMYQHGDVAGDPDNHPNPLTKGYTCPSGYSKHQSGRIKTAEGGSGAAQYICLNMTVPLGSTPIAGTYQCSDGGSTGNIHNLYTNACACPPGYKSYHSSRIKAPEANLGATQYTCLNNIL